MDFFTNIFAFTLNLVVITILTAAIYFLILKNWWYFSNRNVKFVRGWPILGTLYEMVIGRESFVDIILNLYNQFPNERFFGIFEITHPVFIIRDPELARQITVQHFEHFMNHQGNFEECDRDSLIGRTLFFSRGQEWKNIRTILTPAFTGSKMRLMHNLIDECVRECVTGIQERIDLEMVEMKDVFSRFTTNLIATAAFGLKVNSITDRDHAFFQAGKTLTDFNAVQTLKFFLMDSLPKLMKFIKLKFFHPNLINYFRNVVLSAINYREENNIIRPDMIHLLMQARKGTLESDTSNVNTRNAKDLDDDAIVAQCMIFFFAGFETLSRAVSFMCHELACNPNIQEKLFAEVDQIASELESNGEKLTYETLQKMKYMEMVVSETLRKWTPLPSIDREVTKPINLENYDGITVKLALNDIVWIPVFAIHRDPKYWPEPLKFDPERFTEKNKLNIMPGTYMPFGNGQRACIASRFTMMAIKTLTFYLVKEFEFQKCAKTQDPLIFEPGTVSVTPKNGFWAKFKVRSQ